MINGKGTVVRIIKGSTDTAPLKLHTKKVRRIEIEYQEGEGLFHKMLKGALLGLIVGAAFFLTGHLLGLFAASFGLSLLIGIPALLGACAGYVIH